MDEIGPAARRGARSVGGMCPVLIDWAPLITP